MTMQLVAGHTQDNPFRRYYRQLITSTPLPKLLKVALGHVASKLATIMYTACAGGRPTIPDKMASKMARHMMEVKRVS